MTPKHDRNGKAIAAYYAEVALNQKALKKIDRWLADKRPFGEHPTMTGHGVGSDYFGRAEAAE